jgi:hypothetical protein
MKLFFVSFINLGQRIKLFPRCPETRAPKEPAQPYRVCVGPRVGDCLRLFPWLDNRNKVHVYQTEVDHLPRASYTLPRKYVPDWRKWSREEIWLLSKEGYTFTRVGYVRMFRIEMMTRPSFWYWKRGGEGYDVLDLSCINTLSAPGYIEEEARRHHEMRKFVREIRVKAANGASIKPINHVRAVVDAVKQNMKPYKIPGKINVDPVCCWSKGEMRWTSRRSGSTRCQMSESRTSRSSAL